MHLKFHQSPSNDSKDIQDIRSIRLPSKVILNINYNKLNLQMVMLMHRSATYQVPSNDSTTHKG